MDENGCSMARLELYLNIKEPVELVEMTLSLQALALDYQSYLLNQGKQTSKRLGLDDVKLYITKIESNSILAELAGGALILGQVFSVMDYVNVFIEFAKNIESKFLWFKDVGIKGVVSPDEVPYKKNEIDRFQDFTKLIAKNKGGDLNLSVFEYEETKSAKTRKEYLKITFSSDDAGNAQRGALIASKALERREASDYEKVLMYFYQTNIDDPKSEGRTGQKVVIKRVHDKPLPVYFVSDLDKQKVNYIMQSHENNPFKVSYIVDVNVETDRNEIPRAYRVIRVHDVISEEDGAE